MNNFHGVFGEKDLSLISVKFFDLRDPQPKGGLIDRKTVWTDGASKYVPYITMGMLEQRLERMLALTGICSRDTSTCPAKLIHVRADANVHLNVFYDLLVFSRCLAPTVVDVAIGVMTRELAFGALFTFFRPPDGHVCKCTRRMDNGIFGIETALNGSHEVMRIT